MGRAWGKKNLGGKCSCCFADDYLLTSNTCHKRSKEECHVPRKGFIFGKMMVLKEGRRAVGLGASGLRKGSFLSLFNKHHHLASESVSMSSLV